MKLKDACSLEEKQWQPRQCIKKQRNYFAFKGLYCQSYVVVFFFFFFPVVIHGYESWMIKRLRAKELIPWNCGTGGFLRVPWTARISNQSDLKERTDTEAEAPVLWPGHLMWRAYSVAKILMLRKTEGRWRSVCQRIGWLDDITDSMDMSLSK